MNEYRDLESMHLPVVLAEELPRYEPVFQPGTEEVTEEPPEPSAEEFLIPSCPRLWQTKTVPWGGMVATGRSNSAGTAFLSRQWARAFYDKTPRRVSYAIRPKAHLIGPNTGPVVASAEASNQSLALQGEIGYQSIRQGIALITNEIIQMSFDFIWVHTHTGNDPASVRFQVKPNYSLDAKVDMKSAFQAGGGIQVSARGDLLVQERVGQDSNPYRWSRYPFEVCDPGAWLDPHTQANGVWKIWDFFAQVPDFYRGVYRFHQGDSPIVGAPLPLHERLPVYTLEAQPGVEYYIGMSVSVDLRLTGPWGNKAKVKLDTNPELIYGVSSAPLEARPS